MQAQKVNLSIRMKRLYETLNDYIVIELVEFLTNLFKTFHRFTGIFGIATTKNKKIYYLGLFVMHFISFEFK